MADALDELNKLDETPGLARFLTAQSAVQNALLRRQQMDQQQQFLRDRASLGDNPTPEAMRALGVRNITDPKSLIDLANKMREFVPVTPSGLYNPRTDTVIQPATDTTHQPEIVHLQRYLDQLPPDSPARPAIQARMDALGQPRNEVAPSIHVVPNKASSTGFSYQNLRNPGVFLAEAPAPASATSPESIDAIAKAIREYRQAPLTGFALRSPGAQEIMRRVNELPGPDEKYDAKKFATAQRTQNSFAVGVEGRTVRSFNVAIDHLDTFREAAIALQNGDLKRVNQLTQRIAQETGSPVPTNFDLIKGVVSKEITKAIIGNATAGSMTERQELAAELSRSSSLDQLMGVIDKAQTLMAGQLKGLKQQYEGGLGGSDFEQKFLLPRSREVFSKMQQGNKSEGDWVDRAMKANPGMTREQVTAEGKRLGKIK